jgi:hypothetical protein
METPFKNPESVSVAEEIVAGRPVKSPISATGWAWPLKVRVMECAAIANGPGELVAGGGEASKSILAKKAIGTVETRAYVDRACENVDGVKPVVVLSLKSDRGIDRRVRQAVGPRNIWRKSENGRCKSTVKS